MRRCTRRDTTPPAATCTNILSVPWSARAGGGPGHSGYYCCGCSSLTVGTHYTVVTVVQPTTVYTVVGAWFSGTKHTGSSHSSKNCVVCTHYTRSSSSVRSGWLSGQSHWLRRARSWVQTPEAPTLYLCGLQYYLILQAGCTYLKV